MSFTCGGAPPMPSANRSEAPRPIRLRCRDCDWRGDLTEAVQHVVETDHQVLYKGKVQDVSKHVALLRERCLVQR